MKDKPKRGPQTWAYFTFFDKTVKLIEENADIHHEDLATFTEYVKTDYSKQLKGCSCVTLSEEIDGQLYGGGFKYDHVDMFLPENIDMTISRSLFHLKHAMEHCVLNLIEDKARETYRLIRDFTFNCALASFFNYPMLALSIIKRDLLAYIMN